MYYTSAAQQLFWMKSFLEFDCKFYLVSYYLCFLTKLKSSCIKYNIVVFCISCNPVNSLLLHVLHLHLIATGTSLVNQNLLHTNWARLVPFLELS